MQIAVLIAATVAALAVGGCQKAAERAPTVVNGARGRYVGVGIYAPGQMWSQLVRQAAQEPDPAAANLSDDEQVIVLLDTATGELRQCGNFSGHCIGQNPWPKPLADGQGMPAHLLKHAEQLSAEQMPEPDVQVRVKPAP